MMARRSRGQEAFHVCGVRVQRGGYVCGQVLERIEFDAPPDEPPRADRPAVRERERPKQTGGRDRSIVLAQQRLARRPTVERRVVGSEQLRRRRPPPVRGASRPALDPGQGRTRISQWKPGPVGEVALVRPPRPDPRAGRA